MEGIDIFSDIFSDKLQFECVYNLISPCRGDLTFAIACEHHANVYHNIITRKIIVKTLNEEKKVRYSALVRPTKYFLPFPYKWENNRWCLNKDIVDRCVFAQMNTFSNVKYSSSKAKYLFLITTCLLTNGIRTTNTSIECKIKSFLNSKKVKNYLDSRYKNIQLFFYTGPDTMDKCDMSSLPIFYQIMLFYCCCAFKIDLETDNQINLRSMKPTLFLNISPRLEFPAFYLPDFDAEYLWNYSFFSSEEHMFEPLAFNGFTKGMEWDSLDRPLVYPGYDKIEEESETNFPFCQRPPLINLL